MMLCLLCGSSFKRLASHLSASHNVSWEEYIIRFKFNGIRPTCKCGCGERVTFHKGKFRDFVKGHVTRVPEKREMMIEAGRKAANDPEKCRKNSEGVQRKWQEAGYRERLSGKGNVSLIEREHLQRLHQDQGIKEKMSATRREMWLSEWGVSQREMMRGSDFKSKVSIATIKALDNDEYRQFARDHAVRLLMLGKIKPSRGNCQWIYNPFTDQDEFMHSSWETRFLQESVALNRPVTKVHDVRISYIGTDDREHVYVPDFVSLEPPLRIFEVKGLETETDLRKYEAALEWCEEHDAEFSVVGY